MQAIPSESASQRASKWLLLVNALGLFAGGALGAGLKDLERCVEGGHLGAGGDELSGELVEFGDVYKRQPKNGASQSLK